MKRKQAYAILKEAQEDREPVSITLAQDSQYRITGFVVGLNEVCVILHRLNISLFALNGYDVVPLAGLASVSVRAEYDEIIERGIRAKGLKPSAPQNIDIDNGIGTLLTSIDAHFPLTALYRTRKRSTSCHIGRIADISEKSVKLREIDPDARWNRTRKLRYQNIARIGFGGGYEDMLWTVSQTELERSGRSIENDKKSK